jgi:S-adenosylmethionine synthetase
MTQQVIFITGLSGILGKAIYKEFYNDSNWKTFGLQNMNDNNNVEEENSTILFCDLLDENSLKNIILSKKPDILIYCDEKDNLQYAEECEKNPEKYQEIFLKETKNIAKICSGVGCWILYISTDFVFDGTHPPYASNSKVNPLNIYGKIKRDCELVIWEYQSDAGLLRIPLIYGEVEELENSSVTLLAKWIIDKNPHIVDDWQILYPTYIKDIAIVCHGLAERKMDHCGLHGTWHWSSQEPFTQYTMAIKIAEVLNLPYDHLIPEKNLPSAKIIHTPHNSQLNCIALEIMGIEGNREPFLKIISNILDRWKQR